MLYNKNRGAVIANRKGGGNSCRFIFWRACTIIRQRLIIANVCNG